RQLSFGNTVECAGPQLLDLLARQLARPPLVLAGHLLRESDPLGLTFADHLALGLGDGRDDVQDEPRGEVSPVRSDREALGDELDRDALPFELLHDLEHVPERAGETVDRGDDESVPLAHIVEGLPQLRALRGLGGGLVLAVGLVDGADGLELPVEMLAGGRDADVGNALGPLAHLSPPRFPLLRSRTIARREAPRAPALFLSATSCARRRATAFSRRSASANSSG